MNEVTRIISEIGPGGPSATEKLLPLVYDELRKLAAVRMADERADHTLDATALVHEAYLRLVGGQEFEGRAHFFAAAAEAMRRILIENARRKQGRRRGGGFHRVQTDMDLLAADAAAVDVLSLDEAIARLAEESPLRAELVKLRFFAGLTVPEAAKVLGISVATAERYWTYARTRLYADLGDEDVSARARESEE